MEFYVKRFLPLFLLTLLICTLPAWGAFRMNAFNFAMFCNKASLAEVKNALNSGSDMDLMAISNAAGFNPDPEVTMFLISEARKAGIDAVNTPYGIVTPLERAVENPNPVPLIRALLEAGAKSNNHILGMAERHCKPSAKSEVLRMLRQSMGISEPVVLKGVSTGNKVNVRTAPRTSAGIITQLSRGDSVTIISERNGWYFLEAPNRKQGWVFGDYIAIKNTNSTESGNNKITEASKIAKIRYQVPPLSSPHNMHIELVDADGKRDIFNTMVEGESSINLNVPYRQEALVSIYLSNELVYQERHK